MGVLSAVLYSTVAFMPLFLIPLQFAGVRKGFKAMIASAVFSSFIIAVWQTIALARSGGSSAGMLAMSISTPAAMTIALVCMAIPRFSRFSFPSRALLGAAVASVISLPSIFAALKDPGVRTLFMEAFEMAGSALGASTLDAETLWAALRTGVASSYGAILFVFLFFSAWSGSRFGGSLRLKPDRAVPEKDQPALPPALSAYRVPAPFVWALLAAWSGLLLNRFFPTFVLSAVALNVALALSICYGVQGLAVAGALAERVGLAPALRILAPIVLILLLLSGTAGFIALGVLALLGTLETWIPFRAAPKGELP
jgi:hypothetical protein